jgi:hypothetical protein
MSQDATEDELVAAITAIEMLLAEEATPSVIDITDRTGWRDAARLATAHLAPRRTPIRPSWHTIERIRRGGYGI